MRLSAATMLLAISCSSVSGFSPISSINRGASISTMSAPVSTTSLYAGGFGGGGGMGGAKKKKGAEKEKKLKPKQQWDRYAEFKTEPKIVIGVRIKDDDSVEWMIVGRVKSKDNKYTEAAVFRQRAIIAEHAKRLYPLQFTSKKTLEWAYHSFDDDDDEIEWKVVDKSALTDAVDGIEKLIGFEGRPDPASGFYCVYDGGRLKLGEESSFK